MQSRRPDMVDHCLHVIWKDLFWRKYLVHIFAVVLLVIRFTILILRFTFSITNHTQIFSSFSKYLSSSLSSTILLRWCRLLKIFFLNQCRTNSWTPLWKTSDRTPLAKALDAELYNTLISPRLSPMRQIWSAMSRQSLFLILCSV